MSPGRQGERGRALWPRRGPDQLECEGSRARGPALRESPSPRLWKKLWHRGGWAASATQAACAQTLCITRWEPGRPGRGRRLRGERRGSWRGRLPPDPATPRRWCPGESRVSGKTIKGPPGQWSHSSSRCFTQTAAVGKHPASTEATRHVPPGGSVGQGFARSEMLGGEKEGGKEGKKEFVKNCGSCSPPRAPLRRHMRPASSSRTPSHPLRLGDRGARAALRSQREGQEERRIRWAGKGQ